MEDINIMLGLSLLWLCMVGLLLLYLATLA